jgi:hypothetical protein
VRSDTTRRQALAILLRDDDVYDLDHASRLEIRSDNSAYPPEVLADDEVNDLKIIGRTMHMTQLLRTSRELLARIWHGFTRAQHVLF